MKPISRIHQREDLPSMAEAVGRETSEGGHIIYLDSMLSRVAKPLRLRTVMRALGWGTARRDAAIAGFVAWKADSKAKTVTSTAAVAVVAGVAATVIGLTAGHQSDHQGPLQRPAASTPAHPVRPFSKPAEAPWAAVGRTSSRRVTAAGTPASSQPAAVMSYAPAQTTARAASRASVPVPSSSLRPSPEPGTPSTPPPAAPSTPQAGTSGRAAPPGATKGGICVMVEPLLSVCVR